MQVRTFLAAMAAGITVGALGVMMLPRSSGIYHIANETASVIKNEAEKAIDSIG